MEKPTQVVITTGTSSSRDILPELYHPFLHFL